MSDLLKQRLLESLARDREEHDAMRGALRKVGILALAQRREPTATQREPSAAGGGRIDIDALGAEIDEVAGDWEGTWAGWIREWPEAAERTHAGKFGLLSFLVPFADRIAAAGKQVLADGFVRDLRSETERERDRIVTIIEAFAEQYPLDLFSAPDPAKHPPWPQYNAPDQYSAAMARHVVAVLLKQIDEDREGAPSK